MYAANLHSLVGTRGLGVECLACQRRSHLTPEAVGASRGDMTEVRTLRLKCTGCGGQKVRLFVLLTPGQIGLWLGGQDVGAECPHQSTYVPYEPGTFRA